MSTKRPFNGAPEGPAPAQGPNQSVYDNPTHGKSAASSAPKKTTSITDNSADPRDDQSTPSRIQEGAVDNPRKRYRGHNEDFSQNDESYSGHPHLSDGSPRFNSQASSPLATPSKSGKTAPVNPKKS
jgi:hypothetical protein